MSFAEKYPMVGQFEYDGILFSGDKPAGIMSPEGIRRARNDFEVRDNDVVIASYPRTGTHWTAEIVSWILLHDQELNQLDTDHFCRFPYIEYNFSDLGVPKEILEIHSKDLPRLWMTHLHTRLAPKDLETKGKVIYTMRNPKDTAVSFFHLYRIVISLGRYEGPWSDFLDAFMDGTVIYGDYFNQVLSWWARRGNKNVLILKYEEMNKNPLQAVRNIAEFLGKTLTEGEIEKIALKTSFEVMKTNPLTNLSLQKEKYSAMFTERGPGEDFVRKGKVGNWKEYFTVAQNERFDKLIEERLHGSGIVFEYE